MSSPFFEDGDVARLRPLTIGPGYGAFYELVIELVGSAGALAKADKPKAKAGHVTDI